MIAIRSKLPVLLVTLLAAAFAPVILAAPAHAAPPVFTVTFECAGSVADITFVSGDDAALEVFYGPAENNIDGNITLDPGETQTIHRPGPELYYEVFEPGFISDQVDDTLDLRDCDDGFIDVDDDLLDVKAFCDGDVRFTNISDDGLEMTYGDLPSDVDGDLVLDPDQSATVNTGRDVLEYSADSAVNDESDRGSIKIPDCDDDDDDDDDDDEDAPTKAPDAGV